MKDEPMKSNEEEPGTQMEKFNIETNLEIQSKTKIKMTAIIAAAVVIIAIAVVIGVVFIKKNENNTPEDEELNRYRSEIQAKIRSAYTDKPLSDNSQFILMRGTFYEMTREYREAINKIREEACNIQAIDPTTGKQFSPEDYVELKWSTDLERIARLRAAENSVKISNDKRPNGGDISEITFNGIKASSEAIEMQEVQDPSQILQRLENQKIAYINDPNTTEANEYKAIIASGNNFFGMSYFQAETDMEGIQVALEFSTENEVKEMKYLDGEEDIYQTIDILKSKIGEYNINGLEEMYIKDSQILVPKIAIETMYTSFPQVYAWPYNFHYYKFSSENNDIVNVTTYGKADAKGTGTSKISLNTDESKLIASMNITVECNHDLYNFFFKEGNITKGKTVCGICGYTAIFTPPNKVSITWSNDQTTPDNYTETVPESNPIGSLIQGKFELDGDEGYKDMAVKISKSGYLDDINIFETEFNFLVVKAGKVNVTFYPKYNTNYTQVFELPLGE